MILYRDI